MQKHCTPMSAASSRTSSTPLTLQSGRRRNSSRPSASSFWKTLVLLPSPTGPSNVCSRRPGRRCTWTLTPCNQTKQAPSQSKRSSEASLRSSAAWRNYATGSEPAMGVIANPGFSNVMRTCSSVLARHGALPPRYEAVEPRAEQGELGRRAARATVASGTFKATAI